ncbi:MAG TPA: inorganic phosphate transporter, partial [Bryobacteraceae bacterium]|nr:inorganic phosphate transporter [Bryobacteraceae bacterium]
MLTLTVAIVVIALVFDYINGFHDAVNSVATIVSTRVLTPLQAVAWAAFFNFVSAVCFGTGVAKTVGAGMVDSAIVTRYVILAGLTGAIVWDLVTWWLGLPTSSSHALFGGLAGAAVVHTAHLHSIGQAFGGIVVSGWVNTLLFMVAAPLI